MARVRNGAVTKARHKKVLKQAKGYFGSKHRLYKTAKEQLMHSGQYAFRDRKQKKRDFRKMWIARINAACRNNDISYSRFIEGLTKAGVEVNRKMLSEIAINDEKAFAELVKVAKDGKAGKITKAEVKVEETKVVKATAKAEKVEKEVKAEKAEKKPAAKKATTTKTAAKKETKTEEKVEKKAPAKKATATKTTKATAEKKPAAKKETAKKTTAKKATK